MKKQRRKIGRINSKTQLFSETVQLIPEFRYAFAGLSVKWAAYFSLLASKFIVRYMTGCKAFDFRWEGRLTPHIIIVAIITNVQTQAALEDFCLST